MDPAAPAEISVLIPTHNGARWLAETLRRVAAAADDISFETIVVDNASTDKTVAIAQEAPGVLLLRNEKNLGFSRAVNRAAAASRGRVLVAINQDLHLQPNSLKMLSEFLNSKKALAGGALSFPDGAEQPSCGPFPTLAGTLGRLLLPRRIRKYRLLGSTSNEAQEVNWVTGAFIGFPRALFDRIGGFDEDYFMYYEDVDFCLRARRAGFPSYFLPSARAVHLAPHSARDDVPDWLRREIRLSQMTFFRKNRPRWEHGAVRVLNRVYFAVNGLPWR